MLFTSRPFFLYNFNTISIYLSISIYLKPYTYKTQQRNTHLHPKHQTQKSLRKFNTTN